MPEPEVLRHRIVGTDGYGEKGSCVLSVTLPRGEKPGLGQDHLNPWPWLCGRQEDSSRGALALSLSLASSHPVGTKGAGKGLTPCRYQHRSLSLPRDNTRWRPAAQQVDENRSLLGKRGSDLLFLLQHSVKRFQQRLVASLYLGESVSAALRGGWEQSTVRAGRQRTPLSLQTEGPGNAGNRGFSLVTFGTQRRGAPGRGAQP